MPTSYSSTHALGTTKSDNSDEQKITCPRCGGKKRFPQYKHVQNGICFKCDGRGYVVVPNVPNRKPVARWTFRKISNSELENKD